MAVAEAGAGAGGDNEREIAGRYRVEQRLAKGGMGVVYRAFDPVHQRTVALKRLHSGGPRSRQRRMFEREYATLVGLRHPRIIDVFEYGVDAVGPTTRWSCSTAATCASCHAAGVAGLQVPARRR